MLSVFECVTCSLLLYMEELNLFAIVNGICYVSDFLRSLMISFKYSLIYKDIN